MKKTISIFALIVMFTACKNNSSEPVNRNMVLVDTTGLYKSNVLTDVGNNKYVINDKVANTPVANKPATSSKKTSTSDDAANNTSTTAATTPVKKDKGLSHAAKGTIVGAGTGAITGAILNKDHRGTGAIIGTVIGAGTGYLIGRATDKKTGRVARAKARKAANQ